MRQVFTDSEQQAEFEREGFVVVRLLSADDAAAFLGPLARVRANSAGAASCTMDLEQSFCTTDAEYRHRMDALCSALIGEALLSLLVDYRLSGCGVMVKRAKAGAMALHRDRTIMADPTIPVISAWCPLVDIDDSRGNLMLLPGSHRLPNVETAGVERFYAGYETELKRMCVSRPLKAGEAILFDNRLLHWSLPNLSEQERPVVRGTAVAEEQRLVFYRLDKSSGGKGFEILDAEIDGPVAHSPDDVADGTITPPTIGYVENRNRPVSLRECRAILGGALPRPATRSAAIMNRVRAALRA